MNKRFNQLIGVLGLLFLMLFASEISGISGEENLHLSNVFTKTYSQGLCDPPAPSCGPLLGNSSGTRFCCAFTDTSCCYAAGCGGNT